MHLLENTSGFRPSDSPSDTMGILLPHLKQEKNIDVVWPGKDPLNSTISYWQCSVRYFWIYMLWAGHLKMKMNKPLARDKGGGAVAFFHSLNFGRLHSILFLTSRLPSCHFPFSAKSISYSNPFPIVSCSTPPLFRELCACSTMQAKLFWMKKNPLLCESPTPQLLGTHCCNVFLQDLSPLNSQWWWSWLARVGNTAESQVFILVQSSDPDMNCAKIWQHLVFVLRFTNLQSYVRKCCYSWKCTISAVITSQRITAGASGGHRWSPSGVSYIFLCEFFKSWVFESVGLLSPFPLLLHIGAGAFTWWFLPHSSHHRCQVQIASPVIANPVCSACWQL